MTKSPAPTMIQIQEAYIARVGRYHAKMTKRSAGLVFARVKRAAREDGVRDLIKLGYTELQAYAIMKDAHDMFLLEANARG